MTAATTNRRLLLAVAAVGVLAGVVGIGASIAGVDDDRDASPPSSSTTTTPPDEAAAPSTPAPAAPPAPPAEDPAAAGEEPTEEPTEAEEAAREAQLEAEAAVPRVEAEQIAQAQVTGPVDRARISDETGTPVWEVRIDGPDGNVDVLVDATTGQVLEVDD